MNVLFLGEDFIVVQREIGELIENKIVVGHGLKNDWKALFINHPKHLIRDTFL